MTPLTKENLMDKNTLVDMKNTKQRNTSQELERLLAMFIILKKKKN